MKKAILTLAVLCGIGLIAGCKNGTFDESTTDTDEEIINQYNADGKKDGLWRYNEGDVMITEVHYDNGNECVELKMFLDGKLWCHISDIEKADTMIGENLFEYRAHYKEFEDGSFIIKEPSLVHSKVTRRSFRRHLIDQSYPPFVPPSLNRPMIPAVCPGIT